MSVLLLTMLVLGAGLAMASLRRIPEDTACTVHRFGRYVRTLPPGVRFTLPFIDQIAHRVRLVGHRIELAPQALDEATAAHAAVYYQILEPERAGDALDDVDALVAGLAQQQLALIADSVPPAESVALAQRLKSELNQRLDSLGLRITRCTLQLSPA